MMKHKVIDMYKWYCPVKGDIATYTYLTNGFKCNHCNHLIHKRNERY